MKHVISANWIDQMKYLALKGVLDFLMCLSYQGRIYGYLGIELRTGKEIFKIQRSLMSKLSPIGFRREGRAE